MARQKRVAAIHDISCFGKCSLTVALPILSAAGIDTAVIPTAVLSTHTGGFPGGTCRDLTDDIMPIADHWQAIGLEFDAVYTGYLGSLRQLGIVSGVIDKLRSADTLVVVDPVMADNGRLYKLIDPAFPEGMKNLCRKADIIVPNMTEAALLTGTEYREGPYTEGYIRDMSKRLAALGVPRVVLTGVCFDGSRVGCACYDSVTGQSDICLHGRVPGIYHGTGDIFACVLVAALLNGKDLATGADMAVRFTEGAIRRTKEAGTDVRCGVDFESGIGELIRELSY